MIEPLLSSTLQKIIAKKNLKVMSMDNLLPPANLTASYFQSRASRGRFSRPSTALLEPFVPVVESKKRPVENTSGRPRSGNIRPLSSRVYLRRTVKKGWIAKGIDEKNEEEDDLGSNTGSLDSFFDDDFDDTPQSEVLGGFLSCNTLGVETKATKNDWISGDIALPKFHCPRCRDHWYGVSAFPCDEELARLIREGKWYTGNEGNHPQQDSEPSKTRDRRPGTSNASNSSYSNNLPDINKRRKGSGINITRSDRTIDFINPNSRTTTKKNRRISFKLDNDDSGLENSGSSGLLHDETGKGRRLKGNKDGNRKGLNKESDSKEGADRTGARNIESSSSASDMTSGSSTTLLKSSLKKNDHLSSLQETSNGDMEKNNNGRYSSKKNKKERMMARNKDGSETDQQTGIGKNEKGLSGKNSKNGQEVIDGFSSFVEDGIGNKQLSNIDSSTVGNVDRASLYSNHKDDGISDGINGVTNGSKANGKEKTTAGREGRRNRGRNPDSLGSSRYSSKTSLNGSQRWSEDGDGNKSRERELVAGKGFMRASSPSQSEWGDPTHARAWASNTASSSCVSLAHLGNDKDVEEVIYLPPIKSETKNAFIASDLMDGFNFTRAFTFSYY